MSEEKKSFILKKTTAGEVFTYVSPMSNPTVSRVIHLTDRVPQQILPLDWALGFIIDQGKVSHVFNGATSKETLQAFIDLYYVR